MPSISGQAYFLPPAGGSAGVISGSVSYATGSIVSVKPVQIIGFVPLSDCTATECRVYNGNCYENRVFGTLNENRSTYQNDWSTFFIDDSVLRAIEFMLQKIDRLGVWQDTVMIGSSIASYSSSYGAFYNYGYFTGHASYIGVLINWGLVLTLQGPGRYRLKVRSQITYPSRPVAFPYCFASEPFNLMAFNCDLADRSVKFEANQSGKIGSHLSNGVVFDLCNITLYDSIRIPGFFGRKKGGYDEIQLEYQTGLIDPVTDENVLRYEFQSRFVPQYIHDRFSVYGVMADSLFVSDYNKSNADYNIRMKRIVKAGEYAPEYNGQNRLSDVKVDFKEGIQSIIKSVSCDPVRQ